MHMIQSIFSTRQNHVFLLMFTDSKTALSSRKILSTFFRGITSTDNRDFYCLNCLHSFKKNKLKSIKMDAKIMNIII